MKALILIAAGLMSSGAIAQSTMGNMAMPNSGKTTGTVTHDTKTTIVRHTGTVTHKKMMTSRHHHMARHHNCMKRMRNGHMMRTCSSHAMKPMHHHTMMHKKVTVETKTKM